MTLDEAFVSAIAIVFKLLVNEKEIQPFVSVISRLRGSSKRRLTISMRSTIFIHTNC
jgi:hypothetical protein